MRSRVIFFVLLLGAAGRALAHPGWGIVVDRGGNVLYTDLEQVWRIGTDGTRTVVVSGVHSHELYLDPAGVLHGEHLRYDNRSSSWGHYLWKLANGNVVRHASQDGFRTGGESFVRDPAGATYWLEGSRIRKRLPDGATVDHAELPRPAPGRAPGGILAIGDDGALYAMSGGDLLRARPGERAVRMASGLDEHVWTSFMIQPWHYVMGLAPDAHGNVYVANSGARRVKRVAPDGSVTVALRARFPWSPTGIAIRGDDVYVLEYTDTGGSVRVRKIGADGSVSIVP